MSLAFVSGTRCSMSRSMMPRPRWTAPGRCPFAHSLSSRTSTSRNFSPALLRRFTSATFVSLIFFFASFTNFKNCAAWAIGKLLQGMIRGEHNTNAMTSLVARRGHSESKNSGRGGPNEISQRLTRRRLCLWFIRGALFRKRAHQVHEVPADFFRRSVAFARHLPFTVADNPKELAVRHLFDGRSVAPVAQLKLHVRSQVTLTVATLAVTHCAIISKEFAHFRQSFRRWRTGFFLAASSGVIFGSAVPGFSWVEFGLAYEIPKLASRIALRTRTVLRMVSS